MPSVLEEMAQRYGLSVSDLTHRLEAERVTRGPGGRDVMLDVIDDNRRRPMGGGPTGLLPDDPIPLARARGGPRVEPNRTGWVTPPAITSPPGQRIIEQLCEADAERQRAAAIREAGPKAVRAEALALIGRAEGALEARLAGAKETERVELAAAIEQCRALRAKL
jgi:hypothetical protein